MHARTNDHFLIVLRLHGEQKGMLQELRCRRPVPPQTFENEFLGQGVCHGGQRGRGDTVGGAVDDPGRGILALPVGLLTSNDLQSADTKRIYVHL